MVERRPFPYVLSGQINIQRNLNVQALLEILGRCFLSQQVNPIWASLWTKPWMFKNIFFSARKIGTFIIKCFNRKLTSSSLLSTGRKTEWVCLIINVKYHLATCHCIVTKLRHTSPASSVAVNVGWHLQMKQLECPVWTGYLNFMNA